jgi:hypothetical protein
MHVWKFSLIFKKKNTITAFVTFVKFVKLVTFVTFVVIRRTLLLFRFDSFDSSFCRTIFDHVQSSQNHVMLSDDAQSFFVCHLIRIRDRFTNAERNASNERNATSLRFEREERRSHSTTLKRKEEKSHSTTLKKKKRIAFDDVVVIRSKTSRMTRNSSHYCVCERSRLRRRRRRLHIELISQNTKTNFLRIVSQTTSSFFEAVVTIKAKVFKKLDIITHSRKIFVFASQNAQSSFANRFRVNLNVVFSLTIRFQLMIRSFLTIIDRTRKRRRSAIVIRVVVTRFSVRSMFDFFSY